jgi:hypothetical protein
MDVPSACRGSRFEVTAMMKTAPFLLSLVTVGVLCSSVPTDAGQTSTSQPSTQAQAQNQDQAQPAAQPASQATATATDGAALPVSIDRIKKALTAPEPSGPPIQKVVDDESPRFVVETKAPRTLMLRSYLDDGTAVPAYVRGPFDPYHSEFLEMTTPDAYKGCGQYAGDQGACAQVMSSRGASGLIWQQLLSRGVDNVLRGMFKQPQQP